MNYRKTNILLAAILTLTGFIIQFIAANLPAVHFGKDGGLFFRIICTALEGAILCGIERKKMRFLFLGLAYGIISYILTALIFVLSPNFHFLKYLDSALWDQIIMSIFVFCFLRKRRNYSYLSKDKAI